jgi:hypothetical protein
MVIDLGGPERPIKHRSFKFAGPHYPKAKTEIAVRVPARGQAWLIRRLIVACTPRLHPIYTNITWWEITGTVVDTYATSRVSSSCFSTW